jgi:hypothetical protein
MQTEVEFLTVFEFYPTPRCESTDIFLTRAAADSYMKISLQHIAGSGLVTERQAVKIDEKFFLIKEFQPTVLHYERGKMPG